MGHGLYLCYQYALLQGLEPFHDLIPKDRINISIYKFCMDLLADEELRQDFHGLHRLGEHYQLITCFVININQFG